MISLNTSALLLFCLLFGVFATFAHGGESSGQQQQQQLQQQQKHQAQQLQEELESSNSLPAVLQQEEDESRGWYTPRFMPARELVQRMQKSKEIADQRYHPVPTLESQLSPAMLRLLLLNQSSRGGGGGGGKSTRFNTRITLLTKTLLFFLVNLLTAKTAMGNNGNNKRGPDSAVARTAALAATIHRKIRAEGENMSNMLGMLKKMEECMKMTEGLRFRKRSPLEYAAAAVEAEDEQMKASGGKRSDSGHRIRALKSLCQM